MSSAREKAEARRAKILASNGTRLLIAKGEKDSATVIAEQSVNLSTQFQTSSTTESGKDVDGDNNNTVNSTPAPPIEILLNRYEKHSGRNTPNLPETTGPLDVLEDDPPPPLIPDPVPSNAPSSSGKESAAARMARIVAASSPDSDPIDAPVQGEEAITPKRARPLAARRRLVSQKAPESSSNGDVSAKVDQLNFDPDTAPALKDEKEAGGSGNGEPINFTPKTVKEIEAEVAKNTKAFDDKVLKKEDESSKEKLALAAKKRLKVGQNPLTTGDILQVIRLIAIIILALHTGYTTVISNGVDDEVVLSQHYNKVHNGNVDDFKSASVIFDKLSSYLHAKGPEIEEKLVEVAIDTEGNVETSAAASAADPVLIGDDDEGDKTTEAPGSIGNIGASSSGATSTWGDWFRKQIRGQVECTFAAVSLIWWASGSLYPVIDSFVIKNKQKNEGIFQKVLAIYAKGLEALIEPLLSTMGELAIHFSILIITHTVVQLIHAEKAKGSGAMSAAQKDEL